ncbi:hypothetical protein Lal_00024723 [Lupinus albus]|uniref:Uncharacterized protein n=1 Tax=Lupinus albus TaxID=3870 RepID=A0A6A4PXB7_LUPAL|nr:hypothetical protein Lalb_Chr10g0105511 [Lupinus albus]KAF1889398.1 hypothetical protein Lal_00024723 [Lupinus albus]
MAIYSRGMVVFGVGIFVVISFCCMKVIEADDDNKIDDSGVTIHAIERDDPPVGCNSHSDAGEECTGEDDKLGLYSDVDDTFKVVKNVAVNDKFQQGPTADDENDSPHILHNNVDVLGH